MAHQQNVVWHLASEATAGAKTEVMSDAATLLQVWDGWRARPPSTRAENIVKPYGL